jgi:hypothetical protein
MLRGRLVRMTRSGRVSDLNLAEADPSPSSFLRLSRPFEQSGEGAGLGLGEREDRGRLVVVDREELDVTVAVGTDDDADAGTVEIDQLETPLGWLVEEGLDVGLGGRRRRNVNRSWFMAPARGAVYEDRATSEGTGR